ncbi:MAG: hypothetical protein ACYS99_07925 [Planctomycetota bacterium]|jgi:hypothetical protein
MVVSALLIAVLASVAVAKPGFGQLFYDGSVVRTVVPPATMSKPGIDDLYVVMYGAAGQLAVAAVAPGDRDYHGGKWAFHSVTWNVAPYLLTSESQVLAAAAAGDVTITRVPENDFKCPIQP